MLGTAVRRNTQLKAICLYGQHGTAAYFGRFANALKAIVPNTRAFQPTVNTDKWHAKVALLLKGGAPVAGIVGSSNLTRPAYGLLGPYWNYECDVIIDPHEVLRTDTGNASVMQAILAPEIEQPSEVDRLNELLAEILSQPWTQIV
jgi:hypothetical protein